MKVRYSDWYETITIRIPELNFTMKFFRNVWKDVTENVAKELLKIDEFICEADLKFSSDLFTTPRHFGIKRFGALGDLIQLLPVIRYMKRTMNHKFTLITQPGFVPTFKPFECFEEVVPFGKLDKSKYFKVFYLDGVLESDHSFDSPEHLKHRIHIYEDFFGIKVDNYDFSFPFSESANNRSKELIKC